MTADELTDFTVIRHPYTPPIRSAVLDPIQSIVQRFLNTWNSLVERLFTGRYESDDSAHDRDRVVGV